MMLIRMWSSGVWRWGYLGTSVTPILIAAEQHRGTTGSLRGLTWNIDAWRLNCYPKKLIIALFSPPPDPAVMMMMMMIMMMKDTRFFLWRWFLCRPVAQSKLQTYPENMIAVCSRCVFVYRTCSCGRKFTCTYNKDVCHGKLKFQWFLHVLFFLWWNEWNTYYFVTKNIHEVWFDDEIIIGSLKMWPNLLDQKYTDCNSNIWLNVLWPFSPQLSALDPQASCRPLVDF